MLKIAKKDADRLHELGRQAETAFDELEALMAEQRDKLAEALQTINDIREEAADVLGGYADDAEQYYDEKSDGWREGERGSIYEEWKSRLSELRDDAAEPVEIETPSEPDRPEWVSALVDGVSETPDF